MIESLIHIYSNRKIQHSKRDVRKTVEYDETFCCFGGDGVRCHEWCQC